MNPTTTIIIAVAASVAVSAIATAGIIYSFDFGQDVQVPPVGNEPIIREPEPEPEPPVPDDPEPEPPVPIREPEPDIPDSDADVEFGFPDGTNSIKRIPSEDELARIIEASRSSETRLWEDHGSGRNVPPPPPLPPSPDSADSWSSQIVPESASAGGGGGGGGSRAPTDASSSQVRAMDGGRDYSVTNV